MLILSLIPPPSSELPLPGDKINHIIAYGTLMGWFAQLYARSEHLFIAIYLLAYGIAIELAQGATGYRFFELLDILANSSGILIAWLLCQLTPAATILQRAENRLNKSLRY